MRIAQRSVLGGEIKAVKKANALRKSAPVKIATALETAAMEKDLIGTPGRSSYTLC